MFETLLLLALTGQGLNPLPTAVTQCLVGHSKLRMDKSQKPSYLKLAFKDEKRVDFAVAVIDARSGRSRMLVCTPGSVGVELGGNAQKQFSDMDGDDYMSSRWHVCSKKQVLSLRTYYKDVPEPANEAVCLVWEDGQAIVYWDGQQFRFKGFSP